MERRVSAIMVAVALIFGAGIALAGRAHAQPPTLVVSPATVMRGQPTPVTIRGTGFAPGEPVFLSLRFVPSDTGETVRVAETVADAGGAFTVAATLPPLGASPEVTERYLFAVSPSLGAGPSRDMNGTAQQPITVVSPSSMPRLGTGNTPATSHGASEVTVSALTAAVVLTALLICHRRCARAIARSA